MRLHLGSHVTKKKEAAILTTSPKMALDADGEVDGLAPLDGDGEVDGLGALTLSEEMEEVDYFGLRVRGYPRDLGQVVECTGQTLWRGGETLAAWCGTQEEWGPCIEVGCGLGLCSLVMAAQRRASNVIATDGDDLALEALRENIALNHSSVVVRKLRWGDLERAQGLRDEFAKDGFSLVLGSDVVYDDRSVEPLAKTVNALLAPDGLFVLAFTHRGVNFESFHNAAAETGLVLCRREPSDARDHLAFFRRTESRSIVKKLGRCPEEASILKDL